MDDEIDLWDFLIAEHLHLTLGQVRELPNQEFVQWCAYLTYKSAKMDFEIKKAQKKKGAR